MLKYIVTAVAVFFASPASAQGGDFCEALGGLAEEFLSQRYDGVPMSTQIKILSEEIEPGDLFTLMRLVIVKAYSEKLNRAQRHEHVAEYRNRWELTCYGTQEDYI